MRDTVFTIRELENGWDWSDIYSMEDVHGYCEEELEIPNEAINTVHFYGEAIEVHLKKSRSMFREDWYVNLTRISA
ncbi:MAG: hypothetical protein KU37_04600 [Sulfuricurvum sp. PC08-66]|nr:MAG: hypothetical protein KU37_04600 [Sulfuricurvum sp. PC08-66]